MIEIAITRIMKEEGDRHYTVIVVKDSGTRKIQVIRNFGKTIALGKKFYDHFSDYTALALHRSEEYVNKALASCLPPEVETKATTHVTIAESHYDNLVNIAKSGDEDLLQVMLEPFIESVDEKRGLYTAYLVAKALLSFYPNEEIRGAKADTIVVDEILLSKQTCVLGMEEKELDKNHTTKINSNWGAFA